MRAAKAVFLDRDGVINRRLAGDYVRSWADFHFLPGAAEGIRLLGRAGFITVVVTNQRCVARNLVTMDALAAIHDRMAAELLRSGCAVDALYLCPHDEGHGCGCRKPAPGMLLRAMEDFSSRGLRIIPGQSYIVGDEEKDVLAGMAAGLKCVKIGEAHPFAQWRAENLLDAARLVCR